METIIFIAANMVDILTTHLALLNPDAIEMNPFYGTHPSLIRLVTVKTIGIIAILLCLKQVKYRREALTGMSILYTMVSVNNLVVGLQAH